MPTMTRVPQNYQQTQYGYAPAGAAGSTRKPGQVDPDDPTGAGFYNQGVSTQGMPGFMTSGQQAAAAAGATKGRNAAAVAQGGTPTGGGGNFAAGYQPYYDPNNPAHQMSADGHSGDLGADNGENMANMWAQQQQSMLDLNGQTQAKRATAAGDRTTVDAAAAAMPGNYAAPTMPGSYQAPAAWQAPGAMPAPYAQTASRDALPTTQSLNDAAGQYTAQLKSGANGPAVAGTVTGGGAAFNATARGASNSMLASLKAQLATQNDTAAGRGRASSGYLDADVGTNARNLAGDSENTILSHALDAASLDQQASTTNANNQTNASEFNSGQGATLSEAGLSAASTNGMNTAQLDQGDYSTDQTFGLNAQNQNYGQAADARNFSRSSYDDDRNFGSQQQVTDYGQAADQRNFGSAQQQTDYGQAADQRNFAQSQYQYDNGDANASEGQYLSQLNGNTSMIASRDQQAAASKGGGIGGILGGVAGTLLGSALGPVGAAVGGKIGSAITGGGQPSNGGGGATNPNPYGQMPGFSPDTSSEDDEEDPYSGQYAGGTYGNNSYGYGGY